MDDLDYNPVTVKARAPPQKKKKSVRRAQNLEDEDLETRNVLKSLNEKFKSKKKNDSQPRFEVENGVATIRNSEAHQQAINRALDYHFNKIFQWEEQFDAIESSYKCCLCHGGVFRNSHGELFGPYYANINVGKNWPHFLAKKPNGKKIAKLELWFHGECALWAPNLHMCGNQLTNLDKKLELFWSQNCDLCDKSGASIEITNRKNSFVHHKCAINEGYKLDEESFSCFI